MINTFSGGFLIVHLTLGRDFDLPEGAADQLSALN